MTETLFIRLGSQAHDTVHWLVVDETNGNAQEIIASGELQGAQQLTELTTKADKRQVKILVPGCDVLLKSLKVPAKSSRAMRLAAPYMLEDSLAEDVEQLFFAYAELASDSLENNCFTAIVAHTQMQLWLSWLEQKQLLKRTRFYLTYLAMPVTAEGWSAIALGDESVQGQVVVRQQLLGRAIP